MTQIPFKLLNEKTKIDAFSKFEFNYSLHVFACKQQINFDIKTHCIAKILHSIQFIFEWEKKNLNLKSEKRKILCENLCHGFEEIPRLSHHSCLFSKRGKLLWSIIMWRRSYSYSLWSLFSEFDAQEMKF